MRERVSRWCMAAHAGNGGGPISTVSAGEAVRPTRAPRATPSAALEAAGVRGLLAREGRGYACACAVWQACVARWRVKAGVCVRMSGVAACGTRWRVDGGGVCACACAVWQGVRVSRWCIAAHAGNGGRPISRVSAGEAVRFILRHERRPAPHWKRQGEHVNGGRLDRSCVVCCA